MTSSSAEFASFCTTAQDTSWFDVRLAEVDELPLVTCSWRHIALSWTCWCVFYSRAYPQDNPSILIGYWLQWCKRHKLSTIPIGALARVPWSRCPLSSTYEQFGTSQTVGSAANSRWCMSVWMVRLRIEHSMLCVFLSFWCRAARIDNEHVCCTVWTYHCG